MFLYEMSNLKEQFIEMSDEDKKQFNCLFLEQESIIGEPIERIIKVLEMMQEKKEEEFISHVQATNEKLILHEMEEYKIFSNEDYIQSLVAVLKNKQYFDTDSCKYASNTYTDGEIEIIEKLDLAYGAIESYASTLQQFKDEDFDFGCTFFVLYNDIVLEIYLYHNPHAIVYCSSSHSTKDKKYIKFENLMNYCKKQLSKQEAQRTRNNKRK